MTSYAVLQWIAIAIAALLWSLSTSLLLEHMDAAGSQALFWSVPVVTVTLAVLPLIVEHALRARRILMGLMLLGLFLILTAYSLSQLVGRTGEVRDAKVLVAEQSARPFELAQGELDRAIVRANTAEQEVLRECRSGFGPKCQGWTTTLTERQARVAELRKELAKLGPARAAPADATRVEALLGPYGVTANQFNLWQPLLLPVGLEFGVWVLLWFGCSTGRNPRRAVVEARRYDAVELALAQAGRPLTNDELAARLGVTKGTASKLVSARAKRIRKERNGKHVMLTLH